jgi:hypothetical protein
MQKQLFFLIIILHFFLNALSMEKFENDASIYKENIAIQDAENVLRVLKKIALNTEKMVWEAQSEIKLTKEELLQLYFDNRMQKTMNSLFYYECSYNPFRVYALFPLYLEDVSIDAVCFKNLVESKKINKKFYEKHIAYLIKLKIMAIQMKSNINNDIQVL